MYCLKIQSHFDSAHFLNKYEGKCSNIHGHHWQVEVGIGCSSLCPEGQQRGMVLDFKLAKKLVNDVTDGFDHKLIIEQNSLGPDTLECLRKDKFDILEVSFRPTAENLSRFIFDILSMELSAIASDVCNIKYVTVYETPDNCCTYTKE